MKHLKLIGTLLSAACMIMMLGASAAQARDPQWMVKGALLANGATKGITAEAEGAQELSAGGTTVSCSKLKLLEALIIGSASPKPGTSHEVIHYEGCSVVGFSACKINGEPSGSGKILTLLLTDFLAWETQEAALKEDVEHTVTVFEPMVLTGGVENKHFATFELTGTCPVTGMVKVTRKTKGQAGVVARNVKGGKELKVQVLEATNLKTYWLVTNNEKKDEELKAGLEFVGAAATYVGKSKISLESGEEFSVL